MCIQHVYDQAWQEVRYQDSLRWSRFKFISTVEAGILVLLFGANTIEVDHCLKVVALILGTFIILSISVLAVLDQRDARSQLNRIKEIEEKWDVPSFKKESLGWFDWFSGAKVMYFILIVVNLCNIVATVLHIANR